MDVVGATPAIEAEKLADKAIFGEVPEEGKDAGACAAVIDAVDVGGSYGAASILQLRLGRKAEEKVLALHNHKRNKEATGELDLDAYTPTADVIEMRDNLIRQIQSRRGDAPPLYVVFEAPFLVAVIERLRLNLLTRHDLASSSFILRDLLSLFLDRAEYTSKRLVIMLHEKGRADKKVGELKAKLSGLSIKSGVTKDYIFEKCGRAEAGGVEDDDYEESEDVTAARAHVIAMQAAGAIAIGKEPSKKGLCATDMNTLLKLRDTAFFCRNVASIDIGCGALARIPFDSLPPRSRAGVEELAVELGLRAEGTIADIYSTVIGPALQSRRNEANNAFMDVMVEVKNMTEPFSAEASAGALGGDITCDLSAVVSMDAVKTKNHATVLLAFLLSESYEESLWRHLGIRIDFMALILRNSFTNIHEQCQFVWRKGEGKCYLLNDRIDEEYIPGLCENIIALVDGTYRTRLSDDKPGEYRMKQVLLQAVSSNVKLISSNLMIGSADEDDGGEGAEKL